jgi:putative transcriptional regulator
MVIKIKLEKLLKDRGISVYALARDAGVAYSTAHHLVKGKTSRIDLATLDAICRALNVQPGEVFERSDHK